MSGKTKTNGEGRSMLPTVCIGRACCGAVNVICRHAPRVSCILRSSDASPIQRPGLVGMIDAVCCIVCTDHSVVVIVLTFNSSPTSIHSRCVVTKSAIALGRSENPFCKMQNLDGESRCFPPYCTSRDEEVAPKINRCAD